MSAKSGNIALDNITRNLKRTNLPKLPPAPGFDGDEEFKEQVELWKKWIAWEKEDPLVLEEDEPKVYQQRVIYCYKQALMALRFWPEIWMDAAEWCYTKDIRENEKEFGTDFLVQGIDANPESVLLALKHADRVEANYPGKEGDKSEYANAVREPHDKILDTLYALGDKSKEREKLEISAIRQQEAMLQQSIEEDDEEAQQAKKSQTEERVHAIQQGYAAENSLLSKTISFVWIALARAMRRIQGKGSQTEGGLRKVFTDARHRGRLSSDVYVAVALLESIVYKDPVGSKIFERGARLFPNDEHFMIEYLKYLHAKDDTTSKLKHNLFVYTILLTTVRLQMLVSCLKPVLIAWLQSPRPYSRPSHCMSISTNMSLSMENSRKSPCSKTEWRSFSPKTLGSKSLCLDTQPISSTPCQHPSSSPKPYRCAPREPSQPSSSHHPRKTALDPCDKSRALVHSL